MLNWSSNMADVVGHAFRVSVGGFWGLSNTGAAPGNTDTTYATSLE